MLAFAFQMTARGGAIEVVRALEERQVRFPRLCARRTRSAGVMRETRAASSSRRSSPIDRMVKV